MTVVGEALGLLQRLGGEALRQRITGEEELDPSELANADDPGLFGPASATWRIHSDASMLVGGVRSLLFQSLHPLAMAGVDEHSDYRRDPWGRLNRTGRFIGATTFGSTSTAEQTIAAVRRIHRRIEGVDPAGRAYSAADPHLLRWVHVIEVDSFLDSFGRYGFGRLTDAERDSYVAEMSRVARRLGVDDIPMSAAELGETIESYRTELESTPAARRSVRFLAAPPDLPLLGRAPYAVIFAAAVGSLPGYAQRMLRLPVPPVLEPLAVRPTALALTRSLGWFMAGTHRAETLDARLLDN